MIQDDANMTQKDAAEVEMVMRRALDEQDERATKDLNNPPKRRQVETHHVSIVEELWCWRVTSDTMQLEPYYKTAAEAQRAISEWANKRCEAGVSTVITSEFVANTRVGRLVVRSITT